MHTLQNNHSTHQTRPIKRLLGRILLDGEFVSSGDLEAALARQKKTNEQLGEILVQMGLLDPAELAVILSIQHDLASQETAVKIAAGVQLLLGELLLKAKRVAAEQIDYALMEQRQTGEKLGETLIRLGLLRPEELDSALAFQRHQGVNAVSEKLKLGELLVARGHVTRRQLEDVLERQRVSKKKIGELLIEAGYADPHHIEWGLRLQQKLVAAALVATLSVSPAIVATDAQAGAKVLSASIAISATVLEHTTMQVLSQMNEFVVTNNDIMRGYVEVPVAARINVKTNNPAGYLLAFEVAGDPFNLFQSMQVVIGGREVQLSPGGGWVPQPYVRGGVTMDVGYRLALSNNAQPGTYHTPLMISVAPI